MKTITITITVPSNSDVRIMQAVEALSEPEPKKVIEKKPKKHHGFLEGSAAEFWSDEEKQAFGNPKNAREAIKNYTEVFPGKRTSDAVRTKYKKLKTDGYFSYPKIIFHINDKVRHINPHSLMMSGEGIVKKIDPSNNDFLIQWEKCVEWVGSKNLRMVTG